MLAPTQIPVSTASLRQRPTDELGYSGLSNWYGLIDDEWEAALKGGRRFRVYREMVDNDPICGAICWVMAMLLRQVEWSVQPAGETSADEEAQEFLEGVLDDMEMTMPQVVSEVATMFPFGFAALEVVLKRRGGPEQRDPSRQSQFSDGAYGIRKLALRSQDSVTQWIYDQQDMRRLLGFEQQTRIGQHAVIPIERVLLFRTETTKDNPEGRSVLRSAYRSYLFRKRLQEIEGIGIERDLAGLPVARVPGKWLTSSASAEERQAAALMRALVQGVRRDSEEGILLSSDRDQHGNLIVDLALLSTAGSRQIQVDPVIQRYAREIATSVLADFIMLGQQKVGSFALSSDKTDLFATALGAFLADVAAVFNRQLVPRLWRVNGRPYETMPTMVPGDLEKPDLAQLGQFLSDLTGAGITLAGDREAENRLREAAGLPPAPEDADHDLDPPDPPGAGQRQPQDDDDAAED